VGEVRQRQRCLSLCKLASACTSRAAAGERTGAQRPGRSRNARTRELADSGFSDWTAAPRMKPAEVGVHTLLRPAHHTTCKCAHPSLFHHRSFALALCFNSKLCAWRSVPSSRLRLNATLVFVLQLVARGRARSRALQGAQRRCPLRRRRPNVNSMTHAILTPHNPLQSHDEHEQHDDVPTPSSNTAHATVGGSASSNGHGVGDDGRGRGGVVGVFNETGPAHNDMICDVHQKPVQLYSKRENAVLCLDCWFTSTPG
jgi:hypothetical protein